MRIVLKKDKQRELINFVKSSKNLTWAQLARRVNCAENYLRYELRNEKRTLSENIYKNLCKLAGADHHFQIISKLNDNWGQVRGGKNVRIRKNLFKTKTPKLLCRKSKELAEIIGILIGDGNIYSKIKSSIYQVRIVGNKFDEKDYMLNYIKPLFDSVFRIRMNVRIARNVICVYKQSKDLVYTLNKYGIPNGNKKTNGIKIPKWIIDDKLLLKNCMRGIFDTDGCVYPKNKDRLFPTIWISSAVPTIRKSISIGCRKLDFKLSKWCPSRNDASIDRRDDVLKFYKYVRFNNSKHLIRWSRFNRLPSSSPVISSLNKTSNR